MDKELQAQRRISNSFKATLLEPDLEPRSLLAPQQMLRLIHLFPTQRQGQVLCLPFIPIPGHPAKGQQREAEISKRAPEWGFGPTTTPNLDSQGSQAQGSQPRLSLTTLGSGRPLCLSEERGGQGGAGEEELAQPPSILPPSAPRSSQAWPWATPPTPVPSASLLLGAGCPVSGGNLVCAQFHAT